MKCCHFFCLLCFVCCSVPTVELTADSRFTFRSYYPSSVAFDYKNLYLYYRFYSVPAENISVNVSITKGSGESGYYPAGYLTYSETGLYENGSYYVIFKDRFKMSRIILGNY